MKLAKYLVIEFSMAKIVRATITTMNKFTPFLMIFFSTAYAFETEGTMVSDVINFEHPGCVITQTNNNVSDLSVLEPNQALRNNDYLELEIETQRNYYPSLSRNESIRITGLANPRPDEITLRQLINGQEDEITALGSSTDSLLANQQDFNIKIFFRAKENKHHYPPNTINIETTLTVECESW